MSDNIKIIESINSVIEQLLEIKKSIATEVDQVVVSAQSTVINETKTENSESSESSDFDSLKLALFSERWPETVNPNFICDQNVKTDLIERGRGLIESLIDKKLQGLKFLDFGCGKGYTTSTSAKNKTTISVGYDIVESSDWEDLSKEDNNLYFTTDFELVKTNGPYDVIFVYDVLDHVENETPTEILKKIKSVLTPDGTVYMRCHPYCSRHATHLYNELNKAYVHLIFTEEELRKIYQELNLEYKKENNIKVLFPLKNYSELIHSAGLRVENKSEITDRVENFFKIPKIAERIMKNNGYGAFPEFQMGVSFVNYVIKH